MSKSKPTENKWIKALELLKHSKLVGEKPELNKERAKREILEQINSSIYRTKYKTQKLRANTLKRAGGLMDKGGYFFMKGDAAKSFDKIKVISEPVASSSDSVVIILVKGRQQFVMKITFVDKKEALEYNAPDTEARFYRIMETLVKKNITPHVFTLTDCLWENIPRTDIQPNFKKFLRKYNTRKTHVYPILTETSNTDTKLITLSSLLYNIGNKDSELVSRILLNLIFQIVYTIYCFVKIDCKHNDLHLGNIFILQRPQNLVKNPKMSEQFKRRYTFDLADGTKKSILLENIGLDVRIFDFDRSIKQKNKFRYHPEGLKSRFVRNLHSYGINSVNNPHCDLFKFLKHIRANVNTPRKVKNVLDIFFIQRSLLLRSEYTNSQGKTVKATTYDGYDYHILDKKLPPGVLMDCDQVLDVLATHVDATPTMKEKSVLESYSTYNIVESEKERVIKTIKSREAIKQASKKAAQKPKTPAAQKPKTPSAQKPKTQAAQKPKTPAAQKPKTPPQKMSRKNSPTKVAKCDDKTTRRSSIKTKNTNKEEKFVNVK